VDARVVVTVADVGVVIRARHVAASWPDSAAAEAIWSKGADVRVSLWVGLVIAGRRLLHTCFDKEAGFQLVQRAGTIFVGGRSRNAVRMNPEMAMPALVL
jgi:hypothetical protein